VRSGRNEIVPRCLTLGALILAASLAAGPVAAGSEPAELATVLERHGIRPVEPPTPAPDFTLDEVSGEAMSLSEHHGNWVLLTFWASWCGPCLSELPSLQQFHAAHRESGIRVVSVAIGTPAGQARKMVESKGLTFPVLIDRGDRIAAQYRAASVPVSFLVDPSGRIAGVARGARDWSRAGQLVNELTTLVPSSEAAERHYASARADEPVELPSNVVPPSGELRLATPSPEQGQLFELEVAVRWAGHLQDYLLHPPEVHLPEGVTQEAVEASTSSQQGTQVVTYTVRLRAEQRGEYSLDPVELRYTPHLEGKLQAARIAGPTVTVVAPTVLGVEQGWFLAGSAGAAAAAAACAVALAVVIRRRRRRARAVVQESPAVRLGRALREARARRVAGDIAAFLEGASEIRKALGEPDETDEENFRKLLERVRYGGERPDDMELDRLERRLERAIRELDGGKDALADEGIRLAEE